MFPARWECRHGRAYILGNRRWGITFPASTIGADAEDLLVRAAEERGDDVSGSEAVGLELELAHRPHPQRLGEGRGARQERRRQQNAAERELPHPFIWRSHDTASIVSDPRRKEISNNLATMRNHSSSWIKKITVS
jgi:hypothetical protein